MPTRRIVPDVLHDGDGKFTFADGERQIPLWERVHLDDATVQAITFASMGVAKTLKELTYQEWLDKVYSVMQIRNRFVAEVQRQNAAHFKR